VFGFVQFYAGFKRSQQNQMKSKSPVGRAAGRVDLRSPGFSNLMGLVFAVA
jgi:hypothetical protein